jgi:kynureninase
MGDLRELDATDPLADFRRRFVVSDEMIYLDGNSLGRMPVAARELMDDLVRRQWPERLVRGWGEGWIDLPRRLGDKIARLVGAPPGSVIVADSTSVNFFKLATAALRARPDRHKIVTESANFPSDLYLLQGCAELLGGRHRIVRVESPDGIHLPPEFIEAELDETTALLTLTHTSFKSGYIHDMRRLTEAAHAVGALVLWDLSHSVGAMPLDLAEPNVDLAVGCCYKYLCGGPGAPAFLYVRKDLQPELTGPIWGWFGQKNAFEFGLNYSPADGIERFLAGTPPILSMAAIEPGVDLLLAAGLDRVRAKSVLQTDALIALWEEHLAPFGVSLNSPRDSALRGSHVSFGHPDALRIDRALIDQKNVIPDFRRPDNIRFGVAPLYTTFFELEQAVLRMRDVIESKSYLAYPETLPNVT